MSIPWGVYVRMQRASDEYDRMTILAAWALGVSEDEVQRMPADAVQRAIVQAVESLQLDPTTRQNGEPVGLPSSSA